MTEQTVQQIMAVLDTTCQRIAAASNRFDRDLVNDRLDEAGVLVQRLQDRLAEVRRLNNMTDAELYERGLRDYEKARDR